MSGSLIQLNPGLDLFPLAAGVLAAVGCALLGNFLVLRRLSMMGDAISHSVLPGLVIAFMLSTSRSPVVMFVGAAVAGVATVGFVELVKSVGRVEPGAAMGVVFSLLFALGVLLIEQASVRDVHLDADCVLHGQLETLVWYSAPATFGEVFAWSTLGDVPRQVWTLLVMLVVSLVFVAVLFKELRLAAFDPGLATTEGFNATGLHYALMTLVAFATVASFEAVGSILVIAMLVCPAATARLLTDRLWSQMVVSVGVALVTSTGGYIAATSIPAAFDLDSFNAAGSMTVAAGLVFVIALLAAPRHGVIARQLKRRALATRIGLDDVLAALFRAGEAGHTQVEIDELRRRLPGRAVQRGVQIGLRRGLLERSGDRVSLTDGGRNAASELVRRHRLWEHYLWAEAGLEPDHVHESAERFEHLDTLPPAGPGTDPHGRPIPGVREQGEG